MTTKQPLSAESPMSPAERHARKCAARLAKAQEQVDAARADLEAIVVVLRDAGWSLARIAETVDMSTNGVLKMLRRQE